MLVILSRNEDKIIFYIHRAKNLCCPSCFQDISHFVKGRGNYKIIYLTNQVKIFVSYIEMLLMIFSFRHILQIWIILNGFPELSDSIKLSICKHGP